MGRVRMRGKRNKYNAQRTEYAGDVYDSLAEATFAMQLDWMMGAGDVIEWQRQVPVHLDPKGAFRYTADFFVAVSLMRFYVDVKGVEPRDWSRVVAMWRAYGKYPLLVLKSKPKDTYVVFPNRCVKEYQDWVLNRIKAALGYPVLPTQED